MLRHFRLLLPLLLCFVYLTACDATGEEAGSEPTQGIVTTVEEVSPNEYKIASEEVVPTPADSRIVVQDLDGTTETYTLDQARAIEQTAPDSSRVHRPFRTAMLGYWGFIMLNRMGGRPPASAYKNNAAYQRATTTAGSKLSTTSRARSGFGGRSSGTSTRSFGG